MSKKLITKCDRRLLQSVAGIIKCDNYYKVWLLLQSEAWQMLVFLEKPSLRSKLS